MVEQPHVEEFLKYIKIYKSASKHTIVNYRGDMKIFFEFTNGKYPQNMNIIRDYTEYLIKERKEAKSTANRRLSALRSYYHYLYDEEIINKKIGDKIKLLKLDEIEEVEVPTKEEILTILNNVDHVRNRAILETMYSNGIREAELCALDITDIDFQNKFISIIKGKGAKSRTIPISNIALKYIKAYIGNRNKGAVFLNNRHHRMGTRSIYNIVMEHCGFAPHMLRHSFATHAIMTSGNMKAVSEILGHASVLITEKRYTHLTKQHLKNSYKNMGMDDR